MKVRTPEETYQDALHKAHAELVQLEPEQSAARSGAAYTPLGDGLGQFQISFLGIIFYLDWPTGIVRRAVDQAEADVPTRLVLMHYLLTADGAAMASKWIAFRNLAGGLGYDAAFQRRANLPLAQTFGQDRAAFEVAARQLYGERLRFGDASFCFRALPHLWLAVVLYVADDEFPASVNVLFDAAANHYLPTEDLAVLGGMLAGRLIKASRTKTP